MISLDVEADSAETDRYGLQVKKLQKDINVGLSDITGTLLHVDSYPNFNPSVGDSSGYYLSLKTPFSAEDMGEDASEKYDFGAELLGGTAGPKVSEDDYWVFKIKDPQTQRIRFFAKLKESPVTGPYAKTAEYSLRGLELAEAE